MSTITKRNFMALAGGVAIAPSVAYGQSATGKPRVMEGPMVGAVTPTSVTLWMRLSGPHALEIAYDTAQHLPAPQRTSPITARAEDDFCVHMTLTGLTPATTYFYRVRVDGKDDDYLGRSLAFPVRTAPEAKWRGRFAVAYGSCARHALDPVQAIWSGVQAVRPDLFFWLGDNIYVDAIAPHVFGEEYRRQRSVPSFQPIARSVPQLATWDDHDYGLNNHDRTNPVKDTAYAAFQRYWANPASGVPAAGGVFFKQSYGGVDFFFLDGRTWRDPNKDPDRVGKTMLGDVQKAWLKQELKNSRAVFKVLIAGSGWSTAKGPGEDSWAAFLFERNELFAYIRDARIGGVVLLSGDTHTAELNCIPWSEQGGYDLYDLVSSPLAQPTDTDFLTRRPELRIRQPYFHSANFGLLQFDTSGPGTLVFTVHDPAGQSVWEPFVLSAADLRNGVSTWAAKIDEDSRAAHARWQKGEPYFGVR